MSSHSETWDAILGILKRNGLAPETPMPNGQTAAEYVEGVIEGALDEIERFTGDEPTAEGSGDASD